MKIVTAAFICAAGLVPATGHASSDEAWEEFRKQVRESCAELAGTPEGAELAIEVNPFGSESYGLAQVTLTYAENQQDRMICVMDKVTGKAELSGPFAALPGAE